MSNDEIMQQVYVHEILVIFNVNFTVPSTLKHVNKGIKIVSTFYFHSNFGRLLSGKHKITLKI